MIISAQNSKIKLVRALQEHARARREMALMVCEGTRLVEETLRIKTGIKFILYISQINTRTQNLIKTFQQLEIPTEEISVQIMNSICDTQSSQGILAVVEIPHLPMPTEPDFVFIAAQIRDPGNLGTILRTAAAGGVQLMIIPPNTTDVYAPKVIRSGMGAHFRLSILHQNWEELEMFLYKNSGLKAYLATAQRGKIYTQINLQGKVALIVGGEAQGAAEPIDSIINDYVKIPMTEGSESLNAASAAAILIYEVIRQRAAAA